ncbi:uncharacterized protein [Apostichopus japonicus]|uniref:uncharacterized protein isoform X4 n=1 Tax=Stichopus japonicus TaxID=307972 RepID=UPI003AB238E1
MAAFECRVQFLNDTDPFATTVFPEPTRPLRFTFDEYLPLIDQIPDLRRLLNAPHELAECGLQLSHTGSYLEVEESINDQKDDFEGYDKTKKHSVVLRTKLPIRVTGILEKLRTSSGRDLRRALFSLKQLFQDDQDLVHEFISAGGLDCLIQLGMGSDQNHRSYILRALGEIMLFMDGMNGIIEHNQAIQWLYSLLTMQYRLVVKSALKLLIVFVEYVETNATLFVKAVKQEDAEQNRDIGANFMNILSDTEQDSEITTYVMTLINKTLNYIPDQDTFYDMTDAFERQDIEGVSQRMCNKSNSDLDLVEQFKLYEYALKQEDGEADIPINKKMNLRKARRSLDVTNQRKSMRAGGLKATSAYSDISKRLSLDSRSSSAELENGDYLSPQRRRREQRRSRDLSMDSEDLMKGNRSDISASPLIVQPPSLVNQATVRHPQPYQRSGDDEAFGKGSDIIDSSNPVDHHSDENAKSGQVLAEKIHGDVDSQQYTHCDEEVTRQEGILEEHQNSCETDHVADSHNLIPTDLRQIQEEKEDEEDDGKDAQAGLKENELCNGFVAVSADHSGVPYSVGDSEETFGNTVEKYKDITLMSSTDEVNEGEEDEDESTEEDNEDAEEEEEEEQDNQEEDYDNIVEKDDNINLEFQNVPAIMMKHRDDGEKSEDVISKAYDDVFEYSSTSQSVDAFDQEQLRDNDSLQREGHIEEGREVAVRHGSKDISTEDGQRFESVQSMGAGMSEFDHGNTTVTGHEKIGTLDATKDEEHAGIANSERKEECKERGEEDKYNNMLAMLEKRREERRKRRERLSKGSGEEEKTRGSRSDSLGRSQVYETDINTTSKDVEEKSMTEPEMNALGKKPEEVKGAMMHKIPIIIEPSEELDPQEKRKRRHQRRKQQSNSLEDVDTSLCSAEGSGNHDKVLSKEAENSDEGVITLEGCLDGEATREANNESSGKELEVLNLEESDRPKVATGTTEVENGVHNSRESERESERERWRRERRQKYRQRRSQREQEQNISSLNDSKSTYPDKESIDDVSNRNEDRGHVMDSDRRSRRTEQNANVINSSVPVEIKDEDDLMRMLRGDSCTKAEIVQGTDDVMPRRRLYSRRRRGEGSGSGSLEDSITKGEDIHKSTSEDSFEVVQPVSDVEKDIKMKQALYCGEVKQEKLIKKRERSQEEDDILNLLRGGIAPVEIPSQEVCTAQEGTRRHGRLGRQNRVKSQESISREETEIPSPPSTDREIKDDPSPKQSKSVIDSVKRGEEKEIDMQTSVNENSTQPSSSSYHEEEGLGMEVERADDLEQLQRRRNQSDAKQSQQKEETDMLLLRGGDAVDSTLQGEERMERPTHTRRKLDNSGFSGQKNHQHHEDDEDMLLLLRGGDSVPTADKVKSGKDADSREVKPLQEINRNLVDRSDQANEKRTVSNKRGNKEDTLSILSSGDTKETKERKSLIQTELLDGHSCHQKDVQDGSRQKVSKIATQDQEDRPTVFKVSMKNRKPKNLSSRKPIIKPEEEEELVSMLRGDGAPLREIDRKAAILEEEKETGMEKLSTSKQTMVAMEVTAANVVQDVIGMRRDDSSNKEIQQTTPSDDGNREEKAKMKIAEEAKKPQEEVKVVRLKLRSKKGVEKKSVSKQEDEGKDELMRVLRGGLETTKKVSVTRNEDIPNQKTDEVKSVTLRAKVAVENIAKGKKNSKDGAVTPIKQTMKEADTLLNLPKGGDSLSSKSNIFNKKQLQESKAPGGRKTEVEKVTSGEDLLSLLKGGDANTSNPRRTQKKDENVGISSDNLNRSMRQPNQRTDNLSHPQDRENEDKMSSTGQSQRQPEREEDDLLSILKGGDAGSFSSSNRAVGLEKQRHGRFTAKEIEDEKCNSLGITSLRENILEEKKKLRDEDKDVREDQDSNKEKKRQVKNLKEIYGREKTFAGEEKKRKGTTGERLMDEEKSLKVTDDLKESGQENQSRSLQSSEYKKTVPEMTKDRDREEQSNLQARGEEPSKHRDDNSSDMALKLARTDQQKQSSSPTDRRGKINARIESLNKAKEEPKLRKKEPYVPVTNQADIKEKILNKSKEESHPQKKVDFVPVTKQAELKEKYLSSSSEQKLPSKKEHPVPTSNQSDIKDKLLAKAVEEGKGHKVSDTSVSNKLSRTQELDSAKGNEEIDALEEVDKVTNKKWRKGANEADQVPKKSTEKGKMLDLREKFMPPVQEGGSLPRNFKTGHSQKNQSVQAASSKDGQREGKHGKGTKDTSKSLEELLDIAVARKSMPRRRKQKQVDKVTGEDEVRVDTDMKNERRDGTRRNKETVNERKRISYEDSSSKLDKRYEVEQKDSKRNEIDLNDERKVTAVGKLRIKKDGVESNDKGKHGQKQVRDTGSLNKMERKLETDNNSLQRKKDRQRSEERRSRKDDVSQRNANDRRERDAGGENSRPINQKLDLPASKEPKEKKKELMDRWLKQKPRSGKSNDKEAVGPIQKNLHGKLQAQRDKWLQEPKDGDTPSKKSQGQGKQPSKLKSKYQSMITDTELQDKKKEEELEVQRKKKKEERTNEKVSGYSDSRDMDGILGDVLEEYDGYHSAQRHVEGGETSDDEDTLEYSEKEDGYDRLLMEGVEIPDLTLSYSDEYSDEDSSTRFFSFPSDEEVGRTSEEEVSSRSQRKLGSSLIRRMTRPSEESSGTLCLTDSDEDEESLCTLKESEISLEQQLRQEVGDDDSVFLAGSFESLDMKSGSELSSMGEKSDAVELRSTIGHGYSSEDLEQGLMKTKSLPSNLDNCHRRNSDPKQDGFTAFTPPSRRRYVKQINDRPVSQAESAESLMSGGTGVSAESGIEIDEKLREGLLELKEDLMDEASMHRSEEGSVDGEEEELLNDHPDDYGEQAKMRVPEVIIQEPSTPTENGYDLHHRRKVSLDASLEYGGGGLYTTLSKPVHPIYEPAIPEDTIAPTSITECKQSTNIETPTPPPEEDQDQKKLRHIPEEPRLSFVPPTATAMDQRRRRPNRDQNKNYSTSKNEVKEPPSIKSSDSTADLNFRDNVVSFRRRNSGSTSEEKPREEKELSRKAAEENQRIAKQSDAIENRIPVGIPQEHTSNDVLVRRESQECQPEGNSVSQHNDVNNRLLAGDEAKETEGPSLQNGGLLDVHPADSEEDDKMNRKVSVSLRNTATVDQRIEKLRISSIDEVPQSPKEIDLENQGSVQQLQDQLTKQGSQDSSEGAPTNVSQLAKSLADLKNNLNKTPVPPKPAEEVVEQPTPKRKETVTDWMMVLIKNKRKLEIKDWDFRDLTSKDDDNVFSFTEMDSKSGSVPPPPPPMGGPPPPPPPPGGMPPPPPPPPPMGGPPPPPPPIGSKNITKEGYMTYPPKGKKTIRLFWRQFTPVPETLLKKNKLDNTIWKSLVDVKLDTRKLETLFESRGKDFLPRDTGKKATDSQKKQFITVLNSKRSNAINIGLTVLPQPETIKQAVLHMDSLVLTKENVERLLSMAPTEEEIDMIRDAQRASPDTPLGSAEDFLMMLASVGALEARLKLWIFKIDYDNQEEEIAEHLADLKTGIDDLQKSKTFMYILAALRAVGNFLNGANVEGFHIEYLSKVSEVKDTSSSKQSLLFHLCSIIREQFPESTDFFSEIGSIKRCAKVDFDELETNLLKLEEECKASWEHLELIYTKHTMSREFYRKTKDLLTDCAQKILVLKVVHVRVLNRFQKLLLFLGMNATAAQELKVTDFCSIVSEFALEYRTIRERHIEIEKKKEDHKKRNKTRGKMITEKFLSKEKAEDAQLKALLTTRGTAPGDETLESRTRARPSNRRGQSMRLVDPEEDEQTDELLTMLVKTRKDSASSRPPRKRERARHSNRKSLRRTLKSGLTDAEKAALGLMPKSPTIKV